MLTEAQIIAAVTEELGDTAVLVPSGAITRWFNEGQARLDWYKQAVVTATWAINATYAAYSTPIVGVDEILYPSAALERRWRPVNGGLIIEDYSGAYAAGDVKVIARVNWLEVGAAQSSELPRLGDAACIAYCLHRAFRRLSADRAVYQRYATLMGENGVSIDDLGDLADDHYRDFLDLRNDLPVEPGATFYADN